MAEDMVNNTSIASPELPSALRTWAALSKGLGLELSLQDKQGKMIDLLRVNRPHSVDSLTLSLLDTGSFESASFGQIDQSSSTGKRLQPTMRYHPDGLESEQIFGPTKDHSCACGRYRLGRERGQVVDYRAKPQFPKECPDCLTPLVAADERRYRMGHIALARPVPNPYLLFTSPVVVGGMSLGFATGIGSVSVTFTGILDGTLSTRIHGSNPVVVAGDLIVALMTELPEFETAAQALLGDAAPVTDGTQIGPREVFAKLCLAYELIPQQKDRDSSERLFNDLLGKLALHPVDFAQRLVETSIPHAKLHILPVIPPSLRPPFFRPPMSRENDITFLYQRVIEADENLHAADVAAQDNTDYAVARTAHFRAIARLMCNQLLPLSHRSSDWSGAQPQLRRSISSMLSGKTGLLLGNLLGKRVDFSARAVIVPAPDLPIDACRLPFDLAVKLYRPLLASALRRSGERDPDGLIARACSGDFVARERTAAALEPLFKKYPVVLNRQPTLHRLGMMAFQPRLGEGAVVGLPALVTSGFNADFDGDQMAVYLPTSLNGRREAERLFPSRHLWHPADGRYALNLSQDLVLGGFLLGEGDHDALKSKIEDSAADPHIADSVHIQSETAFAEVSRHGISFAGDDLRAIAARTTIGNADDCKAAIHALPSDSPIRQIVLSGARGKWAQLPYLAGTVFAERPGSNLMNGLALGERFKLAGDSRDNLVDTKLGTAEGGMLTKFFVAFAEHLYIDADDCGTTSGLIVTAELGSGGEISAGEASRLRRRLFGRVLAKECAAKGISAGHVLGRDDTEDLMQWLLQSPGSNALQIRSPLNCQSKSPACVCRRCYGVPPWMGRRTNSLDATSLVAAGTLVGIIAAQSAGEPSTQMALRSKHLAAGQERGGAAVEKIRKLLAKPLEGQSGSDAQLVDTTQRINEIDRFFTAEDVSVAGVHIEVLVRGRMTMDAAQGWVAQLVGPGANFDQRFVRFALDGARDPLADLKARTVIGARVGA
jgi:DNA-directed RNA polymerase beta' subunit